MANQSSHRARKRFGQNFLHDKNVIEQIVEAFDPDPALAIVEIGPGKGALTLPLLRKAGIVNVIEIDTDLALILEEKCKAEGDLRLHIGDALKYDLSQFEPAPLQIIGNLPYNISTPLIFNFLKQLPNIKCMLLMLQNEVVDRICASDNSAAYGRLSVMIQSQCQVEKLFSVPPNAFTPAPKVTSAVVKLTPGSTKNPLINDPQLLEKIVRHAFSQRRKTLRNALKGVIDAGGLESLEIPPSLRAENLSVKDYINISNQLFLQQNQ